MTIRELKQKINAIPESKDGEIIFCQVANREFLQARVFDIMTYYPNSDDNIDDGKDTQPKEIIVIDFGC